jgi:polyvinyl alcohol dehydrogenase (cytochrome)
MQRLATALALTAILALPTVSAAQDGAALYEGRCAECHDAAAPRTPQRAVLATLTVAQIIAALETGVMSDEGAQLSTAERRAVATFLSTATTVTATARGAVATPGGCSHSAGPLAAGEGDWNGWGASLENRRFHPRPGFTVGEVPSLRLTWAFGFEGEAAAAVQPTIVGDRVFVATGSGTIYSLGLEDGCVDWTFRADAGVRVATVVADGALFFGDFQANAYRLDATTGQLVWKTKLDEHPAARISGSPVFHEGRLYVPMSSLEELTSSPASYECCTFRGSLSAVDAGSGAVIWKSYTIPEEPGPNGTSSAGTALYGPAGAAVWSSPTVDPATGSVYVATGDAYTAPAASTSDAVMAFDMATGAIKWVQQMTEGDAYTLACESPNPANCPEPEGPDHDFGQPPILVSLPGGARALVLGQKSGQAHGLDPDNGGAVLWTTRVGVGGVLGGSEWGSASDGTNLYVAISDIAFAGAGLLGLRPDPLVGGGLHAIRARDGAVVWSAPPPVCGIRPGCSPAQAAPVSVVPGAVFSGALDGVLRAYSTTDGSVLWSFDTVQDFQTANGVSARGGAIDVGGPAIGRGMVLTTSGNGTWGGQRGNVLLAFGVR